MKKTEAEIQQPRDSAFNIDGGIFENDSDHYEEKMSTLGAIINAKDEIDWETIDLSSVTFFCICTHECRRTGTKDVLAPWARINDGKMYICGSQSCSKLEWLSMIYKISAGRGSHVKMSKFFHHEIKQIRLEPSKFNFPYKNLESNTAYNIDGELYANDKIIVTALPGMINLFGKPQPIS